MVDSHDPCANLLAFVCWCTACTVHAHLGFTFRHGFIPQATSERWAGFLGHLAIAVFTVVRTPALTLFLLPGIVHMMVAAGSFLVRDTAQRKEQDPVGRIVSYGRLRCVRVLRSPRRSGPNGWL
ncbi:MAG: hypothetical protein ABW292_10740 [Vicinamibacterales bacterium]